MKIQRKPEWLRKKVPQGEQAAMRGLLSELKLNTVCQQALCPNIAECFSCGQATFLILGRDCTRQCSFCNVDKAPRPLPPDADEPRRVAEAVLRLKLSHVVITSPTRDDLDDGGAGHYAATVAAIRERSPEAAIELLVPDFGGDGQALATVLAARPAILAHNLETVPRLYAVRQGADYRRSLQLLERAALATDAAPTKSGIMLGLGETEAEVLAVLQDLRQVGCSYLSIGQYLAPSRRHQPVVEYILPERFELWRQAALEIGFRHVESSPYTRSSYHAANYA
ncbi:lipoyl synthase [Trichlorobacter sp.]|jgi:lipoyl synthase|uniref:lipoyl synthase n=1 Tax=Trichlorobacter sp. TaxID=2911007 RepID=UPI002A36BD8F|nr:lipoyl synthase [Trichlorobacter sp.]MDY0384725.1 lipoyl synthase [Trichlorobacter sp.]